MLILTAAGLVYAKDLPCAVKPVNSGYVCVCNSTYCDTIESPSKISVGKYIWYTTSNTRPGFRKSTGHFKQIQGRKHGILITVNSNITYQEFKGMGGAFTDLAVMSMSNLSESTQNNLLKTMFSEQGVEFTIIRVPIAGCDFSKRVYTYDDIPGDIKLKHFRLTDEDYNYKIPVIKKANSYSKRGILQFASAWTAPDWMKTNNETRPGFLLKQYYKPWAQYYVKFLDAYAKEGIHFWGLTTGNEPVAGFFIHFNINNLIMMPEEQRKWIKNYLGPALRKSKHSVKVITLDDERPFITWWMDTIMSNKKVADYIDGVAVHWYFDGYVSPEMIDIVHNKYPDKFVIYTESNMLQGGDLGSWDPAASFSSSVTENLNHWTIGYLCWNLALEEGAEPIHALREKWGTKNEHIGYFNFAPIIMNTTSDEFYKSPVFYALGHFSKFIPKGSIIIDVQVENKTVDLIPPDKLERSSIATKMNEGVDAVGILYNDQPLPYLTCPETYPTASPLQGTVTAVASKNQDGSYTVIINNPGEGSVMVTIHDWNRGDISVSLDAKSINSFIYW